MKLFWITYMVFLLMLLWSYWVLHNTCWFGVCAYDAFKIDSGMILALIVAIGGLLLIGLISVVSLAYKKLKNLKIHRSEIIFSIVAVLTLPAAYLLSNILEPFIE